MLISLITLANQSALLTNGMGSVATDSLPMGFHDYQLVAQPIARIALLEPTDQTLYGLVGFLCFLFVQRMAAALPPESNKNMVGEWFGESLAGPWLMTAQCSVDAW